MLWVGVKTQYRRTQKNQTPLQGMAHFVFDLDATLADLTMVYHCVAALRVHHPLSQAPTTVLAPASVPVLETAYALFVKKILAQNTLGILRPGLLDVMKKLHLMKRRGLVASVIIYSNNHYLPNLEFVRDLIHAHVGSNRLISQCIHWDHPLRNQERTLFPQLYPKTWNGLCAILLHTVHGTLPMAKDVLFFDDMDHIDLQNTLQSNYYKVPAYQATLPLQPLLHTFMAAIEEARVPMTSLGLYLIQAYGIQQFFGGMTEFLGEDIRFLLSLYVLRPLSNGGPKDTAFDDGIAMMNEAMEKVKQKSIRMKRRTKRGRTLKKRRFTQR